MTDTTAPNSGYGVHSEVGNLRKVLVCAPGLAHNRLTPANCDDLLFDDVLWVERAQRDHFDFMTKMRERGVEVVELHNLLTEMLASPDAKAWLLDRKITANEVAIGLTLPRAAIEICRQRLTPAHFSRATVLAEVFPPAGAVEAGFLDRVVEAAEFDQELATVLAGIAQLDMTAHAATKLRVRKQALTAIHEAIQLETASYAA